MVYPYLPAGPGSTGPSCLPPLVLHGVGFVLLATADPQDDLVLYFPGVMVGPRLVNDGKVQCYSPFGLYTPMLLQIVCESDDVTMCDTT